MAKIYLIRHAQASYLAENYDKLSPKGEEQSAALGKYLAASDIHFDKIYTGTLERQKHTCAIVQKCYSESNKTTPEPSIFAELNEHHGPKALRTSYLDLVNKDAQMKKWFEEWQAAPELKRKNNLLMFQYFMKKWVMGEIDVKDSKIENWQSFRTRVRSGMDRILKTTQKGESVAVFSSGGTISAIFAEALNIQEEVRIAELNYAVRNTSISQMYFSEGQVNVLSFNELPHLSKEMITFV